MSSFARAKEKREEWLEWTRKDDAEKAATETKFSGLVFRMQELGLDPYLLKEYLDTL